VGGLLVAVLVALVVDLGGAMPFGDAAPYLGDGGADVVVNLLDLVRYLVDTSTIVRLNNSEVAQTLTPLVEAGQVAACAVIDLQLFSLVSEPVQLDEVRALRAASFAWLATDDVDLRRALQVQRLDLFRRKEFVFTVDARPDKLTVQQAIRQRLGPAVLPGTGPTSEAVPEPQVRVRRLLVMRIMAQRTMASWWMGRAS
jgi:hypothetical protein